MKSKIIAALGATSLVFGVFSLQGCYESNYPGYGGYGYGDGSGPTYYSQPVVVREYDSGHHWWSHRDRDEDEHHASSHDHDHDHDRD